VGCHGSCLIATSFSAAEGWMQDVGQQITGGGTCTEYGGRTGSTFSGWQTGFGNNGSWTVDNSSDYCDGVTVAANYPDGGGGRGLRHLRGNGENNAGGGMGVSLPTTASVLWLSMRIRFSKGFTLSPGYTKDVYFHTNPFVIAGIQGGGPGFNVGGANNYGGSLDWNTYNRGSSTADGTWHCWDFYWNKLASSATVWIDGVRVLNSTTINYGGNDPFSSFEWGENQSSVSNCPAGTCWTDYDDLRIDNDLTPGQRIGCAGSNG
jgi:hypothetical protein